MDRVSFQLQHYLTITLCPISPPHPHPLFTVTCQMFWQITLLNPYPLSGVFFSFVYSYMPDVLADPGTGSVLQLLIVMMCSQNYIRNPYLLAKMVEVIFVMQPMVQPKAIKINQALLMHELALSFLTPALMQFYVGEGERK